MVEKLTECANHEFDEKGVKEIDTEEMSKVAEMIKELCEAEYYATITKAMEESGKRGRGSRMGFEMMPMDDYQDDEDYWRHVDMMKGRMFFPEARYDNDMQWSSNDGGRRYTSQGSSQSGSTQGSNDGGMRGTTSSRYGYSYDEYMKEKQMHSGQDEVSKKKRMDKLEEYMDDLGDMAKDMVRDMSPEEKQIWKAKLNKLINM